jgi:hypothetical protein
VNHLNSSVTFFQGYDEGRISIFALGSNSQNFVEKVSIFGQKNGARFGQAIMALGDLVKYSRKKVKN